MALKIYKKIKHNNVRWIEGYCYEFRYTAYENDFQPLCFFINAIKGIHSNSGHQWRLIQCININYIPRRDRKRFVKRWQEELEKGKNVEFTWQRIKSEFPYIKYGIRRYLLKPNYYIRNIRYIPPENIDEEVVKTWHKDFSKTIERKIASRLKKMFTGSREKT